jgi:hypothetical protein
MNIKKIISSIGIGAGAIIIGLGLQYALAAWTSAPTGTPPNCPAGYAGCDAPINVSSSTQTKNGPLTLNFAGIQSIGLKVLGNIQMVDGNQSPGGKVLMDDANGIGSWVDPSIAFASTTGGNNGGYYLQEIFHPSPATLCQVNGSNGLVICRLESFLAGESGDGIFFGDPYTLFTATANGSYGLNCDAPLVLGNDGVMCCRVDKNTGATSCANSSGRNHTSRNSNLPLSPF